MQAATTAHRRSICVVAVFSAALLGAGRTSFAQESRTSELAAKQAEKAQRLEPYTPNIVEKVLLRLEQGRLDPPPVTASFDTVYSGGGLTGNAIYRRHYGDRSSWYARAAYSV